MTININNADRKICEHFLWDLADMATRRHFEFKPDSDDPNSLHNKNSQISIAVGELESHCTIVSQAFKFLNNPPSESTQDIGEYLVSNLPGHLRGLRKLGGRNKGALREDQISAIGDGLYTLFRDPAVILRHENIFMKTFWLEEDVQQIHLWLENWTVVRKVNRKWRNAVRDASNPVRGYLAHLVKTVIVGFFRE